MKTSETKIAAAQPARQQENSGKPFFNKEGQGGFFSEESGRQPEFFFRTTGVQAKLKIGKPGDHYEQEADATAERVVQQLANGKSQTAESASSPNGTTSNGSAAVQKKEAAENADQLPVAKTNGASLLQKKEASEPTTESQALPSISLVGSAPVQMTPAAAPAPAPAAPAAAPAASHPKSEQEEQKKEEDLSKTEEPVLRKPIFDSGSAEPPPADAPPPTDSGQATEIRRKPIFESKADGDDSVQRKASGDGSEAADPALGDRLQASKGGGQPLDNSVRGEMEGSFQADFSSVKIHSDSEAKGLSNQFGARAFTHQNHVYFNQGQFDTGSTDGKRLLAHELTHVVQQGHAPKSSAPSSQSQAAPAPQAASVSAGSVQPQVQRSIFSRALDLIADKAHNIPGFRMFTIILGVNPINMETVDRSAANILRALIEFMPGGNLITQALDNHGVFEKVGTWIEGKIKELGMVGSMFKDAIYKFIDSLGLSDLAPWNWGDVWNRAKRIFTEPIGRLKNFAIGVVRDIIKFVKDAILKPLAAMAKDTRGYDLLRAVLGEDPISGEPVPRTADSIIGGFMKLIGQEEVWENIKKGGAVSKAWAWFQGALTGFMAFVRSIPRRIVNVITSFDWKDIITIAGAFGKVVREFINIAADFGSWVLDKVLMLLEILFSVVAPGVVPYLKKAKGAFGQILKKPIAFVGNLVKAAKQGFDLFATNIMEHLKNSLINWLMGSLAGAGLYIPKALEFKEILKFVLSVLGLTWQNIRTKLVKHIGEPAVKALETGFELVTILITEGPVAAWDKIKEEVGDLTGMIIQEVISFVTTKIVQVAVVKLVSMLNPAGAIIQAIIAIYDTIMFVIEKIKEIAKVGAAVIDSISEIVAGNIGPAAKKVETTLAGMLTLAINFLAKFAKLDKVSGAIMKVIDKIRQPIDKGLDKVVTWIVNMGKKIMQGLTGGKKDVTGNEAMLNAAILKVNTLFKEPGTTFEKVNEKLPGIQKEHNLKVLRLVKSGTGYDYKIHAEINPILDSEPGVLFTAAELVEIDKAAQKFASSIKSNPNHLERYRKNPAKALAGDDEGRGAVIQSGDLVEATAGPGLEILAKEGGFTIIRNATIKYVDEGGKIIGGGSGELDFLFVSDKGIEKIVSAKLKVGRVDLSRDREMYQQFREMPTSPPDIITYAKTHHGANKDYDNIKSAIVMSSMGRESLESFRRKYIDKALKSVEITPLQPSPEKDTGLQLKATREELIAKYIESINKYI